MFRDTSFTSSICSWSAVQFVAALSIALSGCGGGSGPDTPSPGTSPEGTLPSSVALALPTRAEPSVVVPLGTDLSAGVGGLSYRWDFGDGATSAEATPSHAWTTPGRYTVALTVTDATGRRLDASASIDVGRYAAVQGLRCSAGAERGWCWQFPLPHGLQMNDVFFVDRDHGWIVGETGAVLATEDAGVTWQERFIGSGERLATARFADARHGFAFGADFGRVWVTDDGGLHWRQMASAPFDVFEDAFFAGPQLLAAKGGRRFAGDTGSGVTSDSAATWISTPVELVAGEADGTLWGRRLGERTGDDVLKSVDGGRSFVEEAGLHAEPGIVVGVGVDSSGLAWAWKAPSILSGPDEETLWIRPARGAAWIHRNRPQVAGSSQRGVLLLLTPDGGWGVAGDGTPYGNRLFRTSDQGLSWIELAMPPALSGGAPNTIVAGFQALDGRTALLSGYTADPSPRPVWTLTADGARSWSETVASPSGAPEYVQTLRRDAGGGLVLLTTGRWYRSLDDGRTWKVLPMPRYTGPGVNSIVFTTALRGFAISQGALLDTRDGGRTWRGRYGLFDAQGALDGLHFTPDGIGWVNVGGHPYRSIDGGETWSIVMPPAALQGQLKEFRFVDAQNGFATVLTGCTYFDHPQFTDCRYHLELTRDGGKTWQRTDVEVGTWAFHDATHGVLFSRDWAVFRTEDGGATWRPATTPPNTVPAASQIVYVDASEIWAVDGFASSFSPIQLWHSSDGGATWGVVVLPWPARLPSSDAFLYPSIKLHFSDRLHGWAVGADGFVMATVDGGRTWVQQRSGAQQQLTRVFAVDPGSVWIGTETGGILATASGGR